MIYGVLYGPNRDVLAGVGELLRSCIGRRSGHRPRLAVCTTSEELLSASREATPWQVACVDIGDAGSLAPIHEVRGLFCDAELMLVVSRDASPMAYVRPGIMPSCILQRPARRELAHEVIQEFANHLVDKEGEGAGGFLIEGKEGVTRIPYGRILCFEARAKRISACLARERYEFYDTLDHLGQTLPESFARCHRSYIVNLNRVRRLSLSDGTIHLDDGSVIPVSRSFRRELKERLS